MYLLATNTNFNWRPPSPRTLIYYIVLYHGIQDPTMDFDDLVLARHDDDRLAWNQKLSQVGPAVCQLASKSRDNRQCYVADLKCGSFNFCIKVQFEDDGEERMLRFPIPRKGHVCRAKGAS